MSVAKVSRLNRLDSAEMASYATVRIKDRQATGYRVLITSLAWIIYAFILIPSLIVIPISFGGPGEITFPPQRWTLELYAQLFSSSTWMDPIYQSLKVAVITMVISVVLGVPAAYGLVRFEFPGKRLVMMLLMAPVLVPVIIVSLGLYLYFARLGWTGTTAGLVASHVAYVMPFLMMTVIAGVKKLDPDLEFMATIMGASRSTVFFKVVLAQLKPSIAAGALFAFLISFDEVVIAWFLTSASTVTLPVKMYSSIQWDISPVIAAVSSLLTVMSLLVCCSLVYLRAGTPDENH